MPRPLTRGVSIVIAVGILMTGALAFVGEPSRWPGPEKRPQQGEAADLQSGDHSAAALARLVREPQNAWSNLAFVLAGAFLFATATSRIARATGLVLVIVGIGSFLYHASASRSLRHVDVAAMYWLFLIAAGVCVAAVSPRWAPRLEAHAGVVFIASLLLALGLTFARNLALFGIKPFSLRIATAVAAAVIILSLAQVARRRETISAALQLLGIVTLFGAAAMCQTWDRPGGRFYRPDAVVQAHAVWHVLAAITFAWAIAFLDRAMNEAQRRMDARRGGAT